MLLRLFFPYEYVDSVFALDYEKLYQLGYRGLLLDIDNTLVLHGADSNAAVDELFRRIHRAGLKTLLLSNNSEERILRFLAHIDSPYLAEAGKPAPAGYLRALEILGLPKEQVLVIGDQIFTDIYGANRCGVAPSTIYSMLGEKSQNPGVVSIQKLCDGLEISLREFFDDPVFDDLEPVIK